MHEAQLLPAPCAVLDIGTLRHLPSIHPSFALQAHPIHQVQQYGMKSPKSGTAVLFLRNIATAPRRFYA